MLPWSVFMLPCQWSPVWIMLPCHWQWSESRCWCQCTTITGCVGVCVQCHSDYNYSVPHEAHVRVVHSLPTCSHMHTHTHTHKGSGSSWAYKRHLGNNVNRSRPCLPWPAAPLRQCRPVLFTGKAYETMYDAAYAAQGRWCSFSSAFFFSWSRLWERVLSWSRNRSGCGCGGWWR